jgi:beta-galactosidase
LVLSLRPVMPHPSSGALLLRALKFSFLFYIFSGALPAVDLPPGPREITPFDDGWRFWLGDNPAARQPVFDDTSWRTLSLPHDWSIEGPLAPSPDGEKNGGFFSHGIGWYRNTFKLPPTIGKKVVVEFDGVYMNSEVWLNGQFLGRRPYGFIGFRYDLTAFLKTDGSANVLAVRVDDSLEPSVRWYAGSGIYRHVRLITTGYTHFRLDGGVSISTPEINPTEATVQANLLIDANFLTERERLAWIKDSWHVSPTKRDVTVRSTILTPDGTVVANSESTITLESMRAGQRYVQYLTVPKPQLWSDRNPTLYQLRNTLVLDGRALDEITTPFGIRRLAFDPDRGLLVNGQPIKLKGVCLHQDAGSFGNAVPLTVWAWRLAALKEMGCNAIRTSHHPFAPEFYDLCDQLGFYVFDEAFDEWTRDWTYNPTENTRGKSQYGYHLYFEQWHDADLRAMLRRDRNHPSVILYSIGNEIPNQFDPDGFKIARELVAVCHEEDPTRPVTSACDQSFVASRNGFMDALDVHGYNYIDRLYQERTYAPDHERFPHRLFLGTDTSAQLHNWLGVRDHDYVIGDFIWTGIDYLGESHKFPARGNDSGFLDIAGGRKAGFYQRSAYWRDDPVLQITVLTGEQTTLPSRPAAALLKWQWSAGTKVTARIATNCEEVELFLNGRTLGRHTVSQDVYASDWSVDYAPGVLSAVGYRAGHQVSTQELRTAGTPARLQIKPMASPITSDLTLYEIVVVDDAGQPVLDATPAVTVRVDGAGHLTGLDSGDLNYGGMFKVETRDAYQGRLLATVQRTTPAGEVHIFVTSPGLPSAALAVSPKL